MAYEGQPYIHIAVKDDRQPSGAAAWHNLNPGWRIRRWTNDDQERICQEELQDYASLKKLMFPVERVDVTKLFATYRYGGVYSDADVQPRAPINEWVTHFGYAPPVHMILGDEFPRPETGNPFQVESWTFASVPNNPILKRAIDMLPQRLKGMPHDLGHVTQRTGPALITSAVIDFLKEHGQKLPTRAELNEGKGKLIELTGVEGWEGPLRVLILPYRAFGLCREHGDDVVKGSAEDHLVQHNFVGSWKSSSVRSLALVQDPAEPDDGQSL